MCLISYYIHPSAGIKETDNSHYPWLQLGIIIVDIPAYVALVTISRHNMDSHLLDDTVVVRTHLKYSLGS